MPAASPGTRSSGVQGTSCSDFALVASPTTTTFADPGLSPATTYRYRVRAQDATPNFSGYSNIAFATTLSSDATAIGQWTAPFTTPIRSVHVVLMRTGEVLMWDAFASGHEAYVWNPSTGVFTYVRSPSNIFCAGQTSLPDGRIAVFGGHGALSFDGLQDTSLFDPVSRSWSTGAPMTFPRWYPTATPLPDGRVLVVSGATDCDTCVADTPEIYDPVSNTWSSSPARA